VLFHTSLGDVPVSAAVPPLQYVVLGSLQVTMGQSTINVTGRMQAQGSGPFGEVLNLTLAVDGNASGSCAISLNPTTLISAPAAGLNGSVQITTAAGCMWTASTPQPWISLQQTSGTGAGQVGYAIPANPGPARQTTITIAGHLYTVTQAAAPAQSMVQALAVSATSLNFGSFTVGSSSSAQIVTISNGRAGSFALGSLAIGRANTRDFSLATTCALTLAPAADCAINVVFTPSGAGARTAALFVAGNVAGGFLTVALSGSGRATAPAPSIQAIVDAWNYTPGIAPGLWVSISGANLGAFAQTANFAGLQQLPTSVEGVTQRQPLFIH
jgi:Abnormal spindle-like microcephaly-assoc'd, ASPM-SPD-2-Hydin